MTVENPYQPPAVGQLAVQPPVTSIFQQGALLVVPIGAVLPEVCVVTGSSGAGRLISKKLVWMSPWWMLFILLNFIALLIVYLIVKKEGKITYFLSQSVLVRQSRLRIRLIVLLLAALGLLIIGIVQELGPMVVVALLGALVTIIAVMARWPGVKVQRIDKRFIYLRKIPQAVMDEIVARQPKN